MNSINANTQSDARGIIDQYSSPECNILRRAVVAANYAETHDAIDAMKPASQSLSRDFVERHGLMPTVDACFRSFMSEFDVRPPAPKK